MLDIGTLSAADATRILTGTRERLKDKLTFNEYGIISRAIGRVISRINGESDKKAALDREVQRILSQEPFKSQRAQMEADAVLFKRAMLDLENSMHSYWEVKNLASIGVKEPAKGCRECAGAWDSWFNRPRRNALVVDPLEQAKDKLGRVHRDYMDELKAKPVIPTVVGGHGFTEEEEPPK